MKAKKRVNKRMSDDFSQKKTPEKFVGKVNAHSFLTLFKTKADKKMGTISGGCCSLLQLRALVLSFFCVCVQLKVVKRLQ